MPRLVSSLPLPVLALGSALAALVELAAGGPAAAASQGALGPSSSGQIEISLTKLPALQVSGSRDVILTSAGGAWRDSQTICIAGQGVAGYRLSVVQAAVAAHVELDGSAAGRGTLIPVRSEMLDCRDSGSSTLSLAGSGAGHSVVALLISPE